MIKFIDQLGSKISFEVAKILVNLGVKPITVTVLRFMIAAPVSWYFFSQGRYLYNVVGLVLYIGLAVLDWVDGDMAELLKLPKRTAPFGRLIDHTSDRILMLVVLGGLFYAGMKSPHSDGWIALTVLYYSAFLFLTVSLYEFDKRFKLSFENYPQLFEKMARLKLSSNFFDKIIFNLLYVHNNSLTRIFLTHNFLLVFGILTNQLFFTFVLITAMHGLRSVGIFLITAETLKGERTNSALAKVLRKKIEL